MALRINTNIASLTAQRQLGRSQKMVDTALQQLASGKRIVNPGQDAAGLAISENIRAQLGGLKQAKHNAENSISFIQVAEGALNEQTNILIRLRELGIQAASDTVTDLEREFLNQEFDLLSQEFDRIAKTTQFGGQSLLVGKGNEFEFQLGANGTKDDVVKVNLEADSTAGTLGIDGLSIEDQDGARDTLSEIDTALEGVSRLRATFGAIQSRLQSAENNIEIQIENIDAARSRIADVDVADASANLVKGQVMQELGTAVLAQANNLPRRTSSLLQIL